MARCMRARVRCPLTMPIETQTIVATPTGPLCIQLCSSCVHQAAISFLAQLSLSFVHTNARTLHSLRRIRTVHRLLVYISIVLATRRSPRHLWQPAVGEDVWRRRRRRRRAAGLCASSGWRLVALVGAAADVRDERHAVRAVVMAGAHRRLAAGAVRHRRRRSAGAFHRPQVFFDTLTFFYLAFLGRAPATCLGDARRELMIAAVSARRCARACASPPRAPRPSPRAPPRPPSRSPPSRSPSPRQI